ncbi:hypothetical protein AAMO2058_000187100 [Amorphochlora amoebiformis]|eukprot:1351159-Amorphochlora_amoeboformis.AAC.2
MLLLWLAVCGVYGSPSLQPRSRGIPSRQVGYSSIRQASPIFAPQTPSFRPRHRKLIQRPSSDMINPPKMPETLQIAEYNKDSGTEAKLEGWDPDGEEGMAEYAARVMAIEQPKIVKTQEALALQKKAAFESKWMRRWIFFLDYLAEDKTGRRLKATFLTVKDLMFVWLRFYAPLQIALAFILGLFMKTLSAFF